jgi:hypothetical protein
MLIMFTVLGGIIYPLVITGLAQLFFPHQANGSLISENGKIIGSELIGQSFNSARYFDDRPSAAGSNGYDASNSSGSNLGPTSKALMTQIATYAVQVRKENGLASDAMVPTWSPCPPAAWIRISPRTPLSCRYRGWTMPGTCRLPRCRRWWPATWRAGSGAFWASRGSMCWN